MEVLSPYLHLFWASKAPIYDLFLFQSLTFISKMFIVIAVDRKIRNNISKRNKKLRFDWTLLSSNAIIALNIKCQTLFFSLSKLSIYVLGGNGTTATKWSERISDTISRYVSAHSSNLNASSTNRSSKLLPLHIRKLTYKKRTVSTRYRALKIPALLTSHFSLNLRKSLFSLQNSLCLPLQQRTRSC